MKSAIGKIVWAVDTSEPLAYYQNALFVMGALSRTLNSEVIPVHVFRMNNSWAQAGDFQNAYLALAEKRMREFSTLSGLPKMAAGEVIRSSKESTRSAVNSLIEFARNKTADAIVVSTHSKGFFSRALVGSFAETLLLQSEIPVITVNPQTKVRETISNILFPTNFAQDFRPAFEGVVGLAKQLGAGVTLFYKEPYYPMEGMEPGLFRYFEEQLEDLKDQALEWQQWAEAQNVRVAYYIDPSPGTVALEIVRYASSKNFDLIALVSQTELFTSPHVGSLCRQVVRESVCPVWTMKTSGIELDEIS